MSVKILAPIVICVLIHPSNSLLANEGQVGVRDYSDNKIDRQKSNKSDDDMIISRFNHNGQIQFNNNEPGQYALVSFGGQSGGGGGAERETKGPAKITFPASAADAATPAEFANHPPQKKRRRRRRRMRNYRRQLAPPLTYDPVAYEQKKLRPMAGPLAVLEETLESLLKNDNRSCLLRVMCAESFSFKHNKGDRMFGDVIDSITNVLQQMPKIAQMYKYRTSSMVHSMTEFSKAVTLGQSANNAEVCQTAFPLCPNNSLDVVDYLLNNNGGFNHFFNGANFTKYDPDTLHKSIGFDIDRFNVTAFLHGEPPDPPSRTYQGNSYLPYSYQQKQYQQNPYQQNQYQQNPYQQNQYQQNQYQQNQYQQNQYQQNQNQQNQYQQNQYQSKQYRRSSNDFSYKPSLNGATRNIERRIQNKAEIYINTNFRGDKNDIVSKWSFPKDGYYDRNRHTSVVNVRGGRNLKFPERDSGNRSHRTTSFQKFLFPGVQSNREYEHIESNDDVDDDSQGVVEVGSPADYGGELVYVVRGDGDPSRPQLYRLRPGEMIPFKK